jgi:hypothetical protein
MPAMEPAEREDPPDSIGDAVEVEVEVLDVLDVLLPPVLLVAVLDRSEVESEVVLAWRNRPGVRGCVSRMERSRDAQRMAIMGAQSLTVFVTVLAPCVPKRVALQA